ncbi:hypothetical protein K474DRAFT_138588 [Panus rudis PR-1116 ss-1]|nr:hypothetical protein K474DRAFT_138588 [Panus rudis PR-1116 ss-1]
MRTPQPLASRFIRDVPPQADPQQNPSPAQASGSNIPSLPQPSLIAASRIGAVPLPYSPRLWGGRTPSHANRRRAQNTDRANPGAPVATLSPASSPPAATIVASRPLATVSISVPGPSSAATAQPPPSQSQQTPMVPRENLWRRICRRAAEHRWTQTMYEEMMFRLPPEPRRRRSDVTRRNQDLDGEAADEAGDEDKGNIIGLQVAVLIAMPNPNAPSYASWKLGCRAENDVGVDVDVEVASASSSEKGKARESFIEDVLGDLPHLPSMQRDTDGKVHEEGMGDFVIGTAEIKPWPSIATVFVEQDCKPDTCCIPRCRYCIS